MQHILCISFEILLLVLFPRSGITSRVFASAQDSLFVNNVGVGPGPGSQPCSCTECWECKDVTSFVECEATGMLTKCEDFEVCSTEVRKEFNEIKIWKECKQRKACENQRLENWERTPHTCNNDQDHSHCWCCCDNDSCNRNETCEVTATKCPMPSLTMNHGKVACSNTNNLGSLCSYQCTEKDYRGMPSDKQHRLCLGNGKWSEKKPCCVEPCPPYLPLDTVTALQFGSEERHRNRHSGMGPMIAKFNHSKEWYRQHLVYYNDKVYKVVKPDDPVRWASYKESANNTVNTGAVLQYIYDNILEDLQRRPQYNDVLFVSVDTASSDDVTEAAAKLKNAGVLIYYIFYESDESKVNMTEARAVATSEDHIFVVGEEKNLDFEKHSSNMFTMSCNYPCPNDEEE